MPASGALAPGTGLFWDTTFLCMNTPLSNPRGGDIAIGESTFVSSFVNIAAKGKVLVGRNVMLANGCRLETGTHGFEDTDRPIKQQEASSLGIVIEDDCWLGAGVIVVDNVRIGRGSVIGAGSVVTKDIPPFSIAAGVPARVLRPRVEEEVGDQGPYEDLTS